MAEQVIQDVMVPQESYGFSGAPIQGVNRLVTTFEISQFGEVIIQDVYTDAGVNTIQDVMG
jgi:hypothetical protein